MKMVLLAATIDCAACATGGVHKSPGPGAGHEPSEFDAIVKRFVDDGYTSGIAAAIARDDRVQIDGYGKATEAREESCAGVHDTGLVCPRLGSGDALLAAHRGIALMPGLDYARSGRSSSRRSVAATARILFPRSNVSRPACRT